MIWQLCIQMAALAEYWVMATKAGVLGLPIAGALMHSYPHQSIAADSGFLATVLAVREPRQPLGKAVCVPSQVRPRDSLSQGILQRIAAGDETAVSDCVDTYGDLIWSLARRFLRGNADAEDVVQEIYIAVWSHADRFDPEKGSETTFIATIARRRLIDRIRKIGREPARGEDISELADFLEDSESLDAAASADVEIAERAIGELNPKQQTVLRMSIYEGYSHGDIATRLDIPLGTVKTILRRGLIEVRERLETADLPGSVGQ